MATVALVKKWQSPLGEPPAFLRNVPTADSKVAAMSGLAIFEGACAEDLGRLAEVSVLRRFHRGARVLAGAASQDCVVLISGRVKTAIPRGSGFGELALGIFEAGEIVAESCWCSTSGASLGETTALDESTALFLPRQALDLFLETNPRCALRLIQATAMKLCRVAENASRNSCLPVEDRLYHRIVELAASHGTRTPAGILIEHGLFQRDLAASIGASREVVNKQLSDWRGRALIACSRKSLLLMDPEGLSRLVSGAVRVARIKTRSED